MQSSVVGVGLWKNGHPIGLWTWYGPGGYGYTPEIAVTTVPEYQPYYDKQTLQWGYEHGEIQMGLLHLAPVFVPFKYYKKIRINNTDTYWLLCVPPLDWISNWGSYYYSHKAGYYVGFTCQFYDDLGNVLSPAWTRSNGKMSVEVNGIRKEVPTDLTYGYYYQSGNRKTGANTIYSPNDHIRDSGITYNRDVYFGTLWETMGWKWQQIPNERFKADGSELYTITSFVDWQEGSFDRSKIKSKTS